MIKVLLMIIMCKNVIGNIEESNEKYIDLLPEEEKQEFLNRIARRILDEIKSKDTPNESHADITDDQLDAHDAFVQEILKQESDNFKNEKRQIEIKEGKENDRIKRNDNTPNEHDRIDSNTGDKEDHIDLTLREGNGQKRKNSDSEFGKETTTEMFYDVIPVKTIYNQFENDDNKVEVMQVGNSTNKGEGNNTTLEKEQERNVNDEGNVNIISEIGNSSDSILPNNVLINDSINASDKNKNVDNLRKSFHNKFKLGTTEMVDFEPNSDENSTTASNINDEETTPLPTIVSEEITESTLNDENIWVSTQKISDEDNEKTREEQEEETKTVFNKSGSVLSDTITETMTTFVTDFIETSKNKSTNTEISDVTNSDSHNISKDIFLRSDSNEHKDIKTERSVIEAVKLAAVSNMESETISISTIDNTLLSQSGHEVTTENQLQTVEDLSNAESVSIKNNNPEISTHVENGYKENLGVTESVNILKSEDREDAKNEEQNTKREKLKNNETSLRASLDSVDASQIDENEYVQNSGDDSNKVKVYEVFEVDEDQPHFIAAGKVQQNEHPLYVPVYNYAPENAYYRPYNKFGPNIEDLAGQKSFEIEDSKPFNLQNARNSFSGYSSNKKRDGFDKNKGNSKQSYLKLVTKKQRPKNKFVNQVTQNVYNQAIYYNPDDYADLDYYFGRILRRGHKYNSANKNNYKNYFPDSNEDDHPLSVMHKSDTIKDHLRTVRNILYLQKQFGYVPQGNEKTFRKTNQYFQKGGSRKPRKKYKISVDYYFDKADEVENNKEIFRLRKSKLKHNINSNIVPLTPKPFNFERDLENIHEKQELQVDNDSESINREINNVPFKKLFEAMMDVLKDSIEVKNENLVKYDWLKTTVNIQAAMRKLLDLIEQLKSGEYVHPKDIELLKYTTYLFKSSKLPIKGAAMKENVNIIKYAKTLRAKKIENSTKTEKITKIKVPINLWKKSASLRRRKGFELKEKAFNLLSDFEDMLHKLLFYLDDLHDAIKHISIVTEYKNQNWLEDLKALYLQKGSKKNLAKVILHLSLSRLLDSIEDSSMHGVEDNFRIFVEKNRETVKKSREESLFVLNVLNELSRLN